MSEPFTDDLSSARAVMRPLSPGGARRRLGSELRAIREAAGLRLEDAGSVLQRSSATMSRLEGGRLVPRMVDVAALLAHYASIVPHVVPQDTRERVLRLAADSRRKQWFDPLRDVMTGDSTAEHHRRLIEHEADATDIKAYGSEMIPGLLQTPGYARVMAEVFVPSGPPQQRERFAEFRLARQEVLNRDDRSTRYSAAIFETAARRPWGSPAALREQLESLIADLDGARPNVRVCIVPLTATVAASAGGPFTVLSAANGEGRDDLVYLETRSGADYLQAESDVERHQLYFDSLLQSALAVADAKDLLHRIMGDLS